MCNHNRGETTDFENPELADAEGEPGLNGYGACSASGCYCQGFAGSANTCSNCGHNYATHW